MAGRGKRGNLEVERPGKELLTWYSQAAESFNEAVGVEVKRLERCWRDRGHGDRDQWVWVRGIRSESQESGRKEGGAPPEALGPGSFLTCFYLSGPGEWTTWFNIDHPGGQGDYERLDAIHFYYGDRVCARPLRLEARTTDWMPAGSTGQVVHGSPREGFWCLNREQRPGQNCSNYTVRFLCPPGEPRALPPNSFGTGRGQDRHLAAGRPGITHVRGLRLPE